MSLKLNEYLKTLRDNAGRFERTSINGKVNETFRAKYQFKILFALISAFLVCFLEEGFSEAFVSYISSILAILVGLFITALVFSFDKFYLSPPKKNETGAKKEEANEQQQLNSQQIVRDKQAFNYTKQFSYITGYTIVLSIFTLILLSFNTLFPEIAKLSVSRLHFTFSDINLESIKLFGIGTFLAFQRFLILYWLIKITYNTLFIVSSMVQYMVIKIDRQ